MRVWLVFVCVLVCVCCRTTGPRTSSTISKAKVKKNEQITKSIPTTLLPIKQKEETKEERQTTGFVSSALEQKVITASSPRSSTDDECINCEKRHIINLDEDFNKLKTDPELKNHVSAILGRLDIFKSPVHPRIRIFHELLKVGMDEYAHRTADSLYVPDKYNVRADKAGKS